MKYLLVYLLLIVISGNNRRTRVINVLFTLDCFLFSVVTLGTSYPGESFSSAAYRAEKLGKFYKIARPIIDWLFSMLGQKEHCRYAWESAKYNLPEDMR